jgi:hypothetical protein
MMMGFRFGTAINCIDGRTQQNPGSGDSTEKPSKLGLNESPAQNENYGGLFHIHSISYRLLCLGNGENFSGLQAIDNKPIALRNY